MPSKAKSPRRFAGELIANAFPGVELAKQGMPTREISTAIDGGDRQVVVRCPWTLSPLPASLSLEIACCGDASEPGRPLQLV